MSSPAGPLQTTAAPLRSRVQTVPFIPTDELMGDFKTRIQNYETALIGEALREANWNKAETSRVLAIPLRTLKDKVSRFNIDERAHDARKAQALIAFVHVAGDEALDFKDRVRVHEERLIAEALRAASGNKATAARRLQIPLRTLKDKIRSYDIEPNDAGAT